MGDFSDDYGGYDMLGLYEQRDEDRAAQRAKLLTPARKTILIRPRHKASLPQGWSVVEVVGTTTKVWPMTEAQITSFALLGLDYAHSKTVIEMAREAGLDWARGWTLEDDELNRFEAFAELVRADERNRTWTQDHWTEYEHSIAAQAREACAKLVVNLFDDPNDSVLKAIVDAIRARGTT